MSLLPLFNYLQKEADEDPKISHLLQMAVKIIEEHEKLKNQKQRLLAERNNRWMEVFNLNTISTLYNEMKEAGIFVHKSLEEIYANLMMFNYEISKVNFNRWSELEYQFMCKQLQEKYAELEQQQIKKIEMYQKMENREIVQLYRAEQQKHIEIKAKLEEIQKSPATKELLQKLNIIRKERNSKIVSFAKNVRLYQNLLEQIQLEREKKSLLEKCKQIPISIPLTTVNQSVWLPQVKMFSAPRYPSYEELLAKMQLATSFPKSNNESEDLMNNSPLHPILRTASVQDSNVQQSKHVHFELKNSVQITDITNENDSDDLINDNESHLSVTPPDDIDMVVLETPKSKEIDEQIEEQIQNPKPTQTIDLLTPMDDQSVEYPSISRHSKQTLNENKENDMEKPKIISCKTIKPPGTPLPKHFPMNLSDNSVTSDTDDLSVSEPVAVTTSNDTSSKSHLATEKTIGKLPFKQSETNSKTLVQLTSNDDSDKENNIDLPSNTKEIQKPLLMLKTSKTAKKSLKSVKNFESLLLFDSFDDQDQDYDTDLQRCGLNNEMLNFAATPPDFKGNEIPNIGVNRNKLNFMFDSSDSEIDKLNNFL